MISLTANRFNLGQGRRRWNWVIQKAQRWYLNFISKKEHPHCDDDTQILLSGYVYLRMLTRAVLVCFCDCSNLRVAMDADGILYILWWSGKGKSERHGTAVFSFLRSAHLSSSFSPIYELEIHKGNFIPKFLLLPPIRTPANRGHLVC
jgi:hypothetical protein